jgi:hypothetical protein
MIKKILPACVLVVINFLTVSAQVYSLMGTGCNDRVYAIAPDPANSNGVYAGGAFLNAGGTPVNYIAKWNGTSWSAMNSGANFYVRSILSQSASEIYIGGAFNLVGNPSVVAWGVARWNGTAWSGLGNGVRGEVYALENYNSEIYAGGVIDTINLFNNGKGIMKWNGTSWSTLGGAVGNGVSGPPGFKVSALKVFNGDLYIGGTFVTANGITVNNIARWNGTSFSAIGSGTNGEVKAFAVHNNELYIGGAFTTANGVTVNGLAKLSGNTFTAVGGGVSGTVNGLAAAGPFLYATGAFLTAGGVNAQNIARWDGTNWGAIGLGLNFEGNCLTPHSNEMFIGGLFSVAGTVFANNICKYSNPALSLNDPEQVPPFELTPNPALDHILVTASTLSKGSRYSITDGTGKLIANGDLENTHPTRIDLKSLASGVYFLRVENGTEMAIRKFVVQ